MLAVAGTLGLGISGPVTNVLQHKANDMTVPIAQFKSLIPDPDHIFSLGPIHHRFVWYYGKPIKCVPWPQKPDDMPSNATYFLMEWSLGDTAEWRSYGAGLPEAPAPGALPFAWERVAFLPCDPDKTDNPVSGVILGRVLSPEQAAAKSDSVRTVDSR